MKKWKLQEKGGKVPVWRDSPHVKMFEDLAEARKAMIAYQTNPDFQDCQFRLREHEEVVLG